MLCQNDFLPDGWLKLYDPALTEKMLFDLIDEVLI